MTSSTSIAMSAVTLPEPLDLSFRTPFTMLIAGATGSGKTTFVKKMLQKAESAFDRPIGDVYFFYKVDMQRTLDDLSSGGSRVHYIPGLPDLNWLEETLGKPPPNELREAVPIIVIDDQGSELNDEVARLFTVGSHHNDVCVIAIVHQLFGKTPAHRLISRNSKYLVIFKNPRDAAAIEHLAKQMYPGRVATMKKIFAEATKDAYSYVLCDFDQRTDDDYRLRSNVLLEKEPFVKVFKMLPK